MTITDRELWKRLKTVAREWAKPDQKGRVIVYGIQILGFVSVLNPVAEPSTKQTPRAKTRFGRKEAEDKLKEFISQVEAALGVLDSFSQSMVAAHSSFSDGTARAALVAALDIARATDLSHLPFDPERGPSKQWKAHLMHYLAWDYFLWTGRRPNGSKNKAGFTEFARQMLEAMDIKIGNLEYWARQEYEGDLWRKGGIVRSPKSLQIKSN